MLTSELLRQHTKQQSEVRQKSPPLGKAQPEAAKMDDNLKSDQANIGTGTWQLLYPIAAQATSAEFQSYSGLAVGDILELSAGSERAEFVTISRFASVHFSGPTRFEHQAGAPVRRIIEGTGPRYTETWRADCSEAKATPSSRARNSWDRHDDEGFVDRRSWSPGEREHQLQRYHRKLREARKQEHGMVTQPNLLVSIKQPDRIQLDMWPSVAQQRNWCQKTRQAWRVLTSGGDHAEQYIQKRIDAAKSRNDEDFSTALEQLRCDIPSYGTA